MKSRVWLLAMVKSRVDGNRNSNCNAKSHRGSNSSTNSIHNDVILTIMETAIALEIVIVRARESYS